MKREFLKEMGLEKEQIDEIMKEHGKSVQSAKPEDYDELKESSQAYEKKILDLEKALASKEKDFKTFESTNAELLGKLKHQESKELKIRIAREHNIPFDFAHRLNGETEEELAQDAKTLSSLVSKKEVLPLKELEVDSKDNAYKNMIEAL